MARYLVGKSAVLKRLKKREFLTHSLFEINGDGEKKLRSSDAVIFKDYVYHYTGWENDVKLRK